MRVRSVPRNRWPASPDRPRTKTEVANTCTLTATSFQRRFQLRSSKNPKSHFVNGADVALGLRDVEEYEGVDSQHRGVDMTKHAVRTVSVVFGVMVLLLLAPAAFANSFTGSGTPPPSGPPTPPSGPIADFELTYSGANISGDAFLSAADNGNGSFTVTSITGTQTLGGVAQTITGLIAPTSASPSEYTLQTYTDPALCAAIGVSHVPCRFVYFYNDLIYPTGNPLIDFDGLVFTVSGEASPVNICGQMACSNSTPYGETVFTSGQPGSFTNYDFTSLTLSAVPEPSTLAELSLGLALLMLLAWRKSTHRSMGVLSK